MHKIAYFIIIIIIIKWKWNNHVESDRAFSGAEIITCVMPVCRWGIVLLLLAARTRAASVTPVMQPGRRHSGDAVVSRKLQPAGPCVLCTHVGAWAVGWNWDAGCSTALYRLQCGLQTASLSKEGRSLHCSVRPTWCCVEGDSYRLFRAL